MKILSKLVCLQQTYTWNNYWHKSKYENSWSSIWSFFCWSFNLCRCFLWESNTQKFECHVSEAASECILKKNDEGPRDCKELSRFLINSASSNF